MDPFTGIANFRDFGGYPTVDGRRVRRSLLFRSGSSAAASHEDLEKLDELGISLVADLRRSNERTRDPGRRGPAFRGTVIEPDDAGAHDDPWWTFVAGSQLSRAEIEDYLRRYYRAMPFEGRYLDVFRRYFRGLADDTGAVLIHCTAGKDRTGVLAALTLSALDVDMESIVQDYLLTNQAKGLDAKITKLMQRIAVQAGQTPSPDAIRAAVEADRSFLESALAEISLRHGSISGYLREALNVDDELKAVLRQRFVRD